MRELSPSFMAYQRFPIKANIVPHILLHLVLIQHLLRRDISNNHDVTAAKAVTCCTTYLSLHAPHQHCMAELQISRVLQSK